MKGRMNEAQSSEQVAAMAMVPEDHPTPEQPSDVERGDDGEVAVPPPSGKPDVRDPPPGGPPG
ncbi:hypothetical protein LXT21_01490 [Myxococcus sp. K38C18041901]|uniref:hypothetical protein n=1 Tax=Myxococcus guangdongensis TaxID=2906760 RepID=UPI0020A81005|nr:hypothetical protein [Myxococcus guangdongensis]MCP3057445.1 hypothetical protein [Myxococcus guangdongensis]